MTKRHRATALSGISLATIATLMPITAWAQISPAPAAQDAAKAQDDQAGDIVVTAQKREQRLLDVPLAIQAISGKQLEQSGAKELNDVIRSIPGASSVSRSGPGFETIQIRGIASGTTGDSTTGYYVDDVPFGIPNLQIAPPSHLFDLQRVEILRGPQGTLYGQGAMGGTIRMITTSPNLTQFEGRFQGEGYGQSGGKGGYSVDGAGNIPLVEGKLGLRVSGGDEKIGGFIDSTSLGLTDINEQRSWNVRGKLRWEPTATFNLELGAWRVVNELDYRNTVDTVNPPNITTAAPGRPDHINTALTLLSGVANLDLGGAKLTSATGYFDYNLDFDAQYLNIGGPGALRNISKFPTKSFVEELRLASTGSGPLSWVVGGYYSNSVIKSDICLNLVLPCTTVFSININSAGRIKSEAKAVFGELSYTTLGDRLTATVGGRYFSDHRTTSGVDRNTNIAAPANDATFNAFNPRFNLSYKIADHFLVYGNIAKGFRSGSFQTPSQAAAASVATGITIPTAIQPDHVWSYEVGAKGRLFDGVVLLDFSAYIIDWTNIQLNSTISGVATLSNGGDARGKGIDLGVTLIPTRGLQFQFVGNVNGTKFTSILPALVAFNPRSAPGSTVPGVPKASWQVTANYDWSLGGGYKAMVAGGYAFRATQLDSTGLVSDQIREGNVRVGISKDKWRFQIFADNIGNNLVAVARGSLGSQINYPRRIGARFGIDF